MVRGTVVVLAALMVAGCSAGRATSPGTPRFEQLGLTVLVSADGRTITANGTYVCDHAQRLVARSHPDKVELILGNPDRKCQDLGAYSPPIPVSVRLPAPLGHRALIRVGATRGTVPYFDERDLAAVRRLPYGLRLASDQPANFTGPGGQPEIGSTRIYMSPRALLEVTQIVPSPPMATHNYWFNTSCPSMTGWNPRHGLGNCRGVTWVTRDYHFLIGMAVERGMKLSVQELLQTAEGIRISPRQYR